MWNGGLSDDSGRNSVPMEKGAKVLSKENRQAYHSHNTPSGTRVGTMLEQQANCIERGRFMNFLS
jgi:hypothetical protein